MRLRKIFIKVSGDKEVKVELGVSVVMHKKRTSKFPKKIRNNMHLNQVKFDRNRNIITEIKVDRQMSKAIIRGVS